MTNIRKTFCQLFYVWILITLLIPTAGTFADVGPDSYLSNGQQLYETGEYQEALDVFIQAVDREPGNSVYHHWLAKCYGRMAENSGIFAAYDLSKKTRIHLEKSVELKNDNIDALLDLMEFYQKAPGFLGGGPEKAAAICQKIRELNPEQLQDSGEMDTRLPEKC